MSHESPQRRAETGGRRIGILECGADWRWVSEQTLGFYQ